MAIRTERGATIWVRYVEMRQAPEVGTAPAPLHAVSLLQPRPVDLDAYRRLYRVVGDPWQWTMRRHMNDSRLREVLEDERHELWVLSVAGDNAGFAELDYRQVPDCEVVYFGLAPEWIGRGLGRWLMSSIQRHAWSRPIERLWLHTCELDHPGAYDFYLRSGFELYRESRGVGPDPDAVLLW